MKNMKKTAIILALFLLINISLLTAVQASPSLDSVTSEATGFIESGKNQVAGISTSEIINVLKPIASALRTIGIGIILCIGAFMGIKWVTAKPDEVAKLKGQSIGLLIAAIVVIGAYTIWSIALKIVSQL